MGKTIWPSFSSGFKLSHLLLQPILYPTTTLIVSRIRFGSAPPLTAFPDIMANLGPYEELVVKALGRHAFLGQLYNGGSSTLFSENLFGSAEIISKEFDTPFSDQSFKEVKSIQDRVESLDVSASLSLSILGGALDISGFGSYLDRSNKKSESHTLVTVARVLTKHKRLEIQPMLDHVALTADVIQKTRATHVVTGITYGGTALGTVVLKKSSSDKTNEIKGELDLSFTKAALGKISGTGKLSKEDTERLENIDLDVRLIADFRDKKAPAPATATELMEVVKRTVELIGDTGVPYELHLTPISRFMGVDFLFRELAAADMSKITEFYDGFVTLSQNRISLRTTFEQNHALLFPTFVKTCRARSSEVDRLRGEAREKLKGFLTKFRENDSSVNVEAFLEEATPGYENQWKLYNADCTVAAKLLDIKKGADDRKFPLVSVEKLREEMNRIDRATVALVLIPDDVHVISLLNTYRVLADDIQAWRSSQDATQPSSSPSTPSTTVYFSVYIDPLVESDLLILDGAKKSLAYAISTANATKETVFLTFGVSRLNVRTLDWNVLGQEGWGILANEVQGWKYVGDVQGGRRNGFGIISYADGTSYSGGWFNDERDGFGKLTKTGEGGAVIEEGVYLENVLRSDGMVVDTTVINKGSVVGFAKIALMSDGPRSGTVDKIRRVFGWKSDQQFSLQVQFHEAGGHSSITTTLLVNDQLADDSEPKDLYINKHFQNGGELKIQVEVL